MTTTPAPRISAIVRADCGGLGTLSRMFHDYLGFHRTISLARHPGEHHPQWFTNNREVAESNISEDEARWLCDGADVVLSFETWYGDIVPRVARGLGVRTALVPMYECCPPDSPELRHTDLVICPTWLDFDEARHHTPGLDAARKVRLSVPIDTRRIAFRKRRRARVFVHHMGHGGLGGRNSTAEVIAAWRYVRSDARLLVRHQAALPFSLTDDDRITIEAASPENYWELWRSAGDVYLHPTRWDALSLPIHEALAAGMPVMTTRFWPHCDAPDGRRGYLPASSQAMAIPPTRLARRRICREFTSYETTPETIAAAVDRLFDADIESASDDALAYAERHSWQRLAPRWLAMLLFTS
jgi:hypothetical protein